MHARTTAAPLASWYTQGHSDAIGDRLLMFDNTGTASLELLRFNADLASAPGFEDALRWSVERLRPFAHPAFPEVRAVENLEGSGDLALVSTFTPGKRLAEVLRNPRAVWHPGFATWLIRELTPALADLHEQGHDLAHGALSPERIVLTPKGRLVIVEHALGAALDRAGMSTGRLWQQFGVGGDTPAGEEAALNRRSDVIQLGLIALSLLLGRRITSREYPVQVDALLEEFATTAALRSPAFVDPLRGWLERALRLDSNAFGSAIDARNALHELADSHAPAISNRPAAPRSTDARFIAAPPSDEPTKGKDPELHMQQTASADQPVPSDNPTDAIELFPESTNPRILDSFNPEPPPQSERPDPARSAPPPSRPEAVPLAAVRKAQPASVLEGYAKRPYAAIAFAAIAAIEALALGGLMMRRPAAPVSAAPLITVESAQQGDTVLIDGREVGVTPLTLAVGEKTRSIQVKSQSPAAVGAPAAPALPDTSKPAQPAASAAIADAAARQRSGGLRIVAPIDIQVLDGERVLGSSANGPVVTSAGRRQLDFVNNAFGYRARQTVEIRAGQIVSLTVTPPPGQVSINATPWARVWIDGNALGETPLANLPLATGEHEVIFRHPQLGERTEKILVRSGVPMRVSASLGR